MQHILTALQHNSEELERWLQNLFTLLFLREKGYDVLNYNYEFCNCGNCHNNFFIASCIELIFNCKVTFEEIDIDNNAEFYQEVFETDEPDYILGKFIIQDKRANNQILANPLIKEKIEKYQEESFLTIIAKENEAWEIITQDFFFTECEFLEICMILRNNYE